MRDRKRENDRSVSAAAEDTAVTVAAVAMTAVDFAAVAVTVVTVCVAVAVDSAPVLLLLLQRRLCVLFCSVVLRCLPLLRPAGREVILAAAAVVALLICLSVAAGAR